MSRQMNRKDEELLSSNSLNPPSNIYPLISKIDEVHIRNLQNIVSSLCQLINQLLKTLEAYQIQISDKIISTKMIVAIKQASNQLKYHQKISGNQPNNPQNAVSEDLDSTIQMLTKLKIKQNDAFLPKVKKNQDPFVLGYTSQLSTITQKQSQQNLLRNYLRKGSHKKPSKININKSIIFNTSSIQDLQFDVIREQTRKSLDNPYHRNNQTRKNIYNELERTKGQDSLFPAVKNYLQKHRKATDVKSKLASYQIQKLI